MFRNILSFLWDTLKIAVVALVIVVPIRTFVFQPFIVKGASMEPNFHSGDYLIIDELSYRFRDPAREEVVVFKFPQDPSQRYIKRIIGLPGDTVILKGNQILVTPAGADEPLLIENAGFRDQLDGNGGTKIVLGSGEYFVLGDNRPFSSDSRNWGSLPEEFIVGRVLVRLWPPPVMAETLKLETEK